jgi:dipeptidyl aminopeptidase/acylaminoacyl peptidase
MARVASRALMAVVGLSLLYLGVGLFVAARLSAPDRSVPDRTPADAGLSFREVSVRSTDGTALSGWWVPAENSSRAAVLIHGWGGSKADEHVLATVPVYAEAGYSVLMLDLRGHGESGGERRTLGYREVRDVRGALRWLGERGFEPDETVLHGWSMGGATALRAAPGTDVAAVVTEAAYADLPLLLRDELPANSGLPRLFNPGILLAGRLFLDFDPWAVRPAQEARLLRRQSVPMLIIHSTGDEVVPFEHGQMLAAANPEATFWQLEGYEHVEAYLHPEYEEMLLRFLEETM